MSQPNKHKQTPHIINMWGGWKNQGFTLIELMIVVVIVSILAAIAFPQYQSYSRRGFEGQAKQEMLKIADQLERHRNKNFTYRGFEPSFMYDEARPMTEVTLPRGKTGTSIKYTLTIRDLNDTTNLLTAVDDDGGRGWSIRAVANDELSYNLLLTSTGIRCKNTSATLVTYTSCGNESTGSKPW